MQGKVAWFNNEKGFGFIECEESEQDLFVHFSNIVGQRGFKTLTPGQEVTFDIADDIKGKSKKQAVNVVAEGGPDITMGVRAAAGY